jgi:aminoglycoside phosphotransferase (APT) family kinase protein
MLRVSGAEGCAVARLMTREPWRSHGAELTTREHQVLHMLAATDVRAPQSIALDQTGDQCGVPAHLMSFVTGVVEMDRTDSTSLNALATALAGIHEVQPTIVVREYQSWAWEAKFVVPAWSRDPALWQMAFELLRHQDPPRPDRSFLHRDFQPRNVLWGAGQISSVVDWVEASMGPRWLDVAHCSTHLALHHGSRIAQKFGQTYATITGAEPQPYFDVMDIVGNLPAPGREALITDVSQLERLEEHLRAVLC